MFNHRLEFYCLILTGGISLLSLSALILVFHHQDSPQTDLAKIICLAAGVLISLALGFLGWRLHKKAVPWLELAPLLISRTSTDSVKVPANISAIECVKKLLLQYDDAVLREQLIADYSSDLLCRTTDDLKILELNLQSEKIWHFSILSLLSTPLLNLVKDHDRHLLLDYFNHQRNNPSSRTCEFVVVGPSGQLIDLEWFSEWSPSSQSFYCLARDISERKAIERIRNEISSMVGHDLKAPIAGLSFLMDNLLAGNYGRLPDAAAEKIGRSEATLKRLLDLINQLLDAEKIESGNMPMDKKMVPTSELYREALILLEDLAESKKISLNFPESSELILADFDRTKQVLCNILSNAIKWSPPGKAVTVNELAHRDKIRISIRDDGPGIKPEFLGSIFDRYKNAQAVDSPDQANLLMSSGLGLFIARQLIVRQGGEIGVDSIEGSGSTFWFCLDRVSEADLPGYLD